MVPYRACPNCRQSKPLSEFTKSGYCELCLCVRSQEYRQAHPDRVSAHNEAYKLEHPDYWREYRLMHVAERAAYNRQYRLRRAAEVIDYRRKYNQLHASEISAHLRLRAPEISRNHRLRRRARKINAPGWSYTTAFMIRARWEMFGESCYICGRRATATDHVKPLAKGGAHWPCNLRPICGKCNSRKGDKWPYPAQHLKLRK
jgi:5-methylcytosine-specific restriction endonuclease McrA